MAGSLEIKMTKKSNISWRIFVILAIVVVIIWGSFWYFLSNNPDRGTFGDMFGSVNALFSGLAFAGVICAILLQMKELSLQRNELKLTRDELKGQKMQMELQNKTLLKQNFENTFFQLLGLHQQILGAIDLIVRQGSVISGRDCFSKFYDSLKKTWAKEIAKNIGEGKTKEEVLNLVYLKFNNKHQSEFGHYFRSLYHIIKLIDHSDVEDKRLYTNLVRAQLSSYELTLLFYNCLSDLGREKFKPLVEKYALLKNMPKDLLIDQPYHESLYARSAYE